MKLLQILKEVEEFCAVYSLVQILIPLLKTVVQILCIKHSHRPLHKLEFCQKLNISLCESYTKELSCSGLEFIAYDMHRHSKS